MMPRLNSNLILVIAAVVIFGAGWNNAAFALSSDRDQQMFIDADHQKSTQNQDGNTNLPDITYLDGNVVMTQGSMKAHGDHATIYKNPSSVVDANGNSGSLTRVLLVGKQAHMQQVHDGDCSMMTADADSIDYHNDTGIAILTGHVVVIQKDKGESHSEHMIYNRNTGEMESGDNSPSSRVHMVMEPKSAQPAVKDTNNCGFPLGTYTHKASKSDAAKPAAKSNDKP
jgi:lipopolysaccharide export system protein LptA